MSSQNATVYHRRMPKAWISTFASLFLGCSLCSLLQSEFGFSAILAASLLGLAVTFVPIPKRVNVAETQFTFCTGTFVGMSSQQILATPVHLLGVSALGATVFAIAGRYSVGIGGRMGMLALLTSALWLGLRAFA